MYAPLNDYQSFFACTALPMSVLGNSSPPALTNNDIAPTATRAIMMTVPVRRTNGLRTTRLEGARGEGNSSYPLTSLRSQLSPTQYSVLVFEPSPVLVAPHVQTKQVLPALVACTHCPRPEHESVLSLHASSDVKQVETDPMGSCGGA